MERYCRYGWQARIWSVMEMTDDIVTRLRDLAMKEESPWANIYDNVMREAADRIEQLQKEVILWKKLWSGGQDEIDKLRKELSEWKSLASMPQSSPAPRMTCTEHGIKYLCFDDFMDGVWWCSMCLYERAKL
jgi:hypothetical protein